VSSRDAHEGITAAFDEITKIHRLMSFHEPASDVSRLNRDALHRPVAIDPLTREILEIAADLATRSEGAFDVAIGGDLAAWGFLPPPGPSESLNGSWCDIELLADGGVRFHRPLWIDLGGIAKGYAVDRAIERLREHGVTQAVVNAGGDLRVHGPSVERINVRVDSDDAPEAMRRVPVIEIEEGSVASSCGHRDRRHHAGRVRGPHVDDVHRTPASTSRFVCVTGPTCTLADALTKVVMTQGRQSASVLRHYDATAYLHDAAEGWHIV
jgi:thiamine biosynthesis lipoprotein